MLKIHVQGQFWNLQDLSFPMKSNFDLRKWHSIQYGNSKMQDGIDCKITLNSRWHHMWLKWCRTKKNLKYTCMIFNLFIFNGYLAFILWKTILNSLQFFSRQVMVTFIQKIVHIYSRQLVREVLTKRSKKIGDFTVRRLEITLVLFWDFP